MSYELKDYREVPERTREWYARYPEGRIVCEILERPGPDCDRWTVKASVYRTADPNEPPAGVGHSFLIVPGKTPYTKDSELENAETSAAGRALVMAGIPAKSVASDGEVRAKNVDGAAAPSPSTTETDVGPEAPVERGEGDTGAEGPRPVSDDTLAKLTLAYGSRARAKQAIPDSWDVASLRALTEDQGRRLLAAKENVA